jgi:hypothetical protein
MIPPANAFLPQRLIQYSKSISPPEGHCDIQRLFKRRASTLIAKF